MKLIPAAHELISNVRGYFQANNLKLSHLSEEPLRAELFSSEQAKRFGKTLAVTHRLSTKPTHDHLLKRLADNEILLTEVRKLLSESLKKKDQITPAAEWLIDNYYLIEEHIRNAKINFPKRYSEDLPQLSNAASEGVVRIYDIVLEIISHSDGRIDIENLSRFINAYQSVTILQLGELWAIPIMLRLVLIENLRRIATLIAIDRVDENLADYWARQVIEASEKNPKSLILVISDMMRSNPPMVGAFVAELIRQLRGKGPDLALSLNWIDLQLAENGLTSTELVNAEIQKQAANQVSISNTIGSLRLLGAMDWRDFVEKHSIVERTLREDINGIYGSMNFSTRDRYRHVVENIAKKTKMPEHEVARIAIQLAADNTHVNEKDDRTSHVGYYLIGPGVSRTKEIANTPISVIEKIRYFFIHEHQFPLYLTFILLITFAISAGILLIAHVGTKDAWLLVAITVLSLLSASQLAVSVVNFFSTLLVKPHLLPRMDFSHKIPSDSRTLVMIPAMLSSMKEIENLVELLEVRFLANRNDNLHFGLLTDFMDARQETLPQDGALVESVQRKIEALNKKYLREESNLFFLFHRPRVWNPKESVWMGYERKRGKISALNSLLRGSSKESFSCIVGDQSIFPEIKYVITLDADTQLPMGAAWKLIGTMAHPLNHPWYDEKKHRITKGYGILQPRVSVSLPDITGSLYARMQGNEPGLDPYTRATSDVYQDLFEEGSFIGKGIYDVDAFINVLDGKFAENSILSHDLLEGCYVRSGLLSDVHLFEKYPTRYQADMKRRSRWTRGDWQIFSWFLPFVPDARRHWRKNPISSLSRWKIFDNIRRSLVPLALTSLLLMGWFVLPSSLLWTGIVSGIIIVPIIITTIWDIIRKPKDVVIKHHIRNFIHNIADIFVKTLFSLITLPYEAFSNLMAISRTLWRMLISRKNLLEWNPSGNEGNTDQSSLMASYSVMWIEPFLASAVAIYLMFYAPIRLFIAGPIVLLWVIAPVITWWISKPMAKLLSALTHQQNVFLRRLARKTWSFFELFVGQDDNWLPPDNFQEQPVVAIAHRTSPTNIGLSLLSSITAHDFGYLTTGQLIERTANTIGTMLKMERYRGHFYNWYDTQSLNPLFPKYISTVDSGNLVGHLLVFRQGLLAIPGQQIIGSKLFEGLEDTLGALTDTLKEEDIEVLELFEENLRTACRHNLNGPQEVKLSLGSLAKDFDPILEKLNNDSESETYWWKQKLKTQLERAEEELQIFMPWLLLETVPSKFTDFASLNQNSTLTKLLRTARKLQVEVNRQRTANNTTDENEWLDSFQIALTESIRQANDRITAIEYLAQQCNELADVTWDFLYDKTSHLLTIGYNAQEHRKDESSYDLLASEVRLCIFIGIAQGKLPEESWFALGRLLTNVDDVPILLSWSGSMFEYLMPLLVMPTFENTLLDQSSKAAVICQINYQNKYGKQAGQPWGVSESGYNMINADSHYQYRAFGVPGLGLKRGLEDDSVIAPYASALALMTAPEKACKNLELLQEKGFEGRFGFYEAIDYTLSRLPRGQTHAIVYSFMTHHQAMSLLSLAYLLLDKPMQKLFEAEPQFKATLLLLQERIPKATTYFAHTTDIADIDYAESGAETRIINTPNTRIPEVHLLSNGRYHVMITSAGAGYSRWKDLAVTRWREDGTRDNWGVFCYIRDVKSKAYWSNSYQPTLQKGEKYEVAFSLGRADFHSTNNDIETHTALVVSPEDDIEIRRASITNYSNIRRIIEVTSYAEIVLASAASDLIQPAFSNLFVQTEITPSKRAILCTRRPRSATEQPPWLFHLMTIHGKDPEGVSYETDRMKFVGRGRTTADPQAMDSSGSLSGNQGSVLDPIVAIRYKITIEPEETVLVDMVIGISETREICEHLIDKYQDKHHKNREFELAWTHSQVVLRQINASAAEAQLFGRLASAILFSNSSLRADPTILINNHRGQSGLWGYSISGDLPIVLLTVEKHINIPLVRQLIQAHAYWRLKGLVVDLVIWNEERNIYRQDFQEDIQKLIPAELRDRPGGIFVRVSDQIANEDRILFQTVARVTISDHGGTLADHVKRKPPATLRIPYLVPKYTYKPTLTPIPLPEDLLFFNGLGGFSKDGKEYVIIVDNENRTPAPWVNVIANPQFGTVISESGSAYTWAENAHEFRLTPWHNDPVSDSSGEAFYIRDYESGHFWSAALLPSGSKTPYITRHGFGYSIFEHLEDGIYSEMLVYVDIEAAIKFTVIKIRNQSGRPRKLSATGYTEWVLGDNRTKTAMQIQTEVDPDSDALFAKNPYNTEFPGRVAFFDVDKTKKTITADRTEFIGRNGTLKTPDAMLRLKLSGKIGLALDPCGAIQVPFDLIDGEEYEVIFRLGAGKNHSEASAIVRQFRGSLAAHKSFEKVEGYWKNIIGTLQVETPDAATNILTNGWLTYQTISSRLWGRSGFYQSGGAFGFRDQLQDVLSLLHATPHLAREQILRCASRQFKEGDVQHWWHPPVGRGVRTRCSDDYLWLPYATSLYIAHSGDSTVLDESVRLLEGRLLNSGEESYYDLPIQSIKYYTLYDHCVLAIKHGFNYGEHGLPLIGTGDWNDGFDKVGEDGKGESVWMAFFFYDVLIRFAKVAHIHNDQPFADVCKKEAHQLKQNINKHAWDGQWYKRAWFDNGTPLGSSGNKECQIDSIAQSWSVLSGAGDDKRKNTAMKSAYKNLVQKDARIIQLLEPPFDKNGLNPGYIKGYVPGVRENGGQYTHAAIWMIIAFAKLDDNERVWELLNMINPINHGRTSEEITVYKVEPYVLAADVYALEPHEGSGGWTWYTGSAGWMYRLIIESFLGLQQEGNKLKFKPCVPKQWESFKLIYRYKSAVYHISVTQKNGGEEMVVTVDGVKQENKVITLTDDGAEHHVQISLTYQVEMKALD
jgi:cyclic beta-1,2-glucan glucanotransferase